ncbi:hypothetical protein yc1106_03888 [Curvularia clavata]|uniref:BTB domain-containing protein n=1 Tax=Curvularia clavata TaxID=95742 RepID=A0A9Q9DSC6_CURCL|nr:hypothetical protein yc1106_03888 [Curvularia clavata]
MASPPSGRVIIDSTGDALVTLNNSGVAFGAWNEPLYIADNSGDTRTEGFGDDFACREERDGAESPSWMKWGETLKHDEREQPEPQDHPQVPSLSDSWIQKSSAATDSVELDASTAIVYQVSLAHLATASPTFRMELQSCRKHQKDHDGFSRLECSDWDPEAFEILLNTLHTRYRRVPKQLTLELLAKVAVMVEHYKCWEAFEPISQTWIRHVRVHHPMPSAYCRELMLWMLIAWVFKLPKEFTKTTTLALQQCTESRIQDMGLVIPPSILQALENRRLRVIEEIIETFNKWIDEFSDTYICKVDANLTFECSSILLGALMKQMRNIGILSLRAVAPFDGFSIENVYESVKMLKSPIWETYDEINELYPIKHSCGFQGTIVRDVEHILARVKGLSLNDFLNYSEGMDELTLGCA